MINQTLFSGFAYKFITADTFKLILQHGTLRFTRGDQFNDPFEANPYLIPVDWQGLVNNDKSNVELVRIIANEAFTRVSSKIYITCFSGSYLEAGSHLMWSHYGDHHRGLCFEINFPKPTQDIYKKGEPVPIRVKYCKSLFEERAQMSVENPDLPLYLTTVKSDVWAYENEVRMIMHSDVFDQTKFNFINGGKNADVVFNIEWITRVIFGARTSIEDMEGVVKLFCQKGFLPEFYRIDLNPVTLEFFEEKMTIRDEIIKYNDRLTQAPSLL